MTQTASTLRRVVWLFPDRESTRTNAKWSASFWQAYQDVAKDMGLSFDRVAPEAVTTDALDPRNPKVYIDGEQVTPDDTLFLSSLYSLPYQSMDVFNQLTLYNVLSLSGFYMPHPPEMATVCNDKLATILFLKDCPVPPVPTVRIGSGRDLVYDEYEVAIKDLTYPAFSKPAGWATSRGINLVRDSHDVRGLLSLAQGGDTTMVFQPYLGTRTVDYRVFLIDGKADTVMVRSPGDGAPYPQVSTGATVRWDEVPAELAACLDYFVQKLPVPFVALDFLHDGDRFWLSEIEFDAGIFCPDSSDPEAVRIQRHLIRSRFEAYRTYHSRFLGGEL